MGLRALLHDMFHWHKWKSIGRVNGHMYLTYCDDVRECLLCGACEAGWLHWGGLGMGWFEGTYKHIDRSEVDQYLSDKREVEAKRGREMRSRCYGSTRNEYQECSMAKKDAWKWYGNVGHYYESHLLRFHMCTVVGNYYISTIGDLRRDIVASDDPKRSSPLEIDTVYEPSIRWEGGALYETVVFITEGGMCECGCGMPEYDYTDRIEHVPHNTRGEANEAHMAICEKYARTDDAEKAI